MIGWLHDVWAEDPLPVPPAAYGSMAWWRWWSALTLARRLNVIGAPVEEAVL